MENAITELAHIIDVLSRSDIKKHELTDTQVINRVLQAIAKVVDQPGQIQTISVHTAIKLEELRRLKYPSEIQLASLMRLRRISKSLQESKTADRNLVPASEISHAGSKHNHQPKERS